MKELSTFRLGHTLSRYKRELAVALTYLALLLIMGAVAPSFYTFANLRDLLLGNAPVLMAATGMTLVILAGHIDISTGAQFAVCTVMAGWLAKIGAPNPLLALVVPTIGAMFGAVNGGLVAGVGVPSIVATLATMALLREGLRLVTEGEWLHDLPARFQWFGLGQMKGQWIIVIIAFLVFAIFAWSLRNLAAGRALYATGSDREAARLAGLRPRRVAFAAFVLAGFLVGLAALCNSVRFMEVQGNAGVGLEMKVIAAVVVGGASITGGRGTLAGTFIGVLLLGTIGTALTFVGINPFWEKAIQGLIILAAAVADALAGRARRYAGANPIFR
jgi:rhamnose transport system permease protein